MKRTFIILLTPLLLFAAAACGDLDTPDALRGRQCCYVPVSFYCAP